MNSIETFFGAIESTADALRVFELCRQGKLGRVRRRFHDAERRQIRSGSVFVFDEAESGIRRWTDGRLWSPSRIHGNFLVYRELERRHGINRSSSIGGGDNTWTLGLLPDLEGISGVDPRVINDDGSTAAPTPPRTPTCEELGLSESLLEKKNRALQRFPESTCRRGSTASRYVFKRDGLVKRTISAKVDGHWQHLVCYYSRTDFASVLAGPPASERLFSPILLAELRGVRIPIDLVMQQSFRRPPVLTASIGPGRGEVPLVPGAGVKPARSGEKQTGFGASSTTSTTPVPIVTGHEALTSMVDEDDDCGHSLMAACVAEAAAAAVSRALPTPFIAVPSAMVATPMPNLLDLMSMTGNRQVWIVGKDLYEEYTDGNDDCLAGTEGDEQQEEEWSGYFLRGTDPALPHLAAD